MLTQQNLQWCKFPYTTSIASGHMLRLQEVNSVKLFRYNIVMSMTWYSNKDEGSVLTHFYSIFTKMQWHLSCCSINISSQETSVTDAGDARRLVANQWEVMTRLLELLYVLNIKRNIFSSVLHIPTLWYLGTSVTYPPWLRRVKLVVIPPRFV